MKMRKLDTDGDFTFGKGLTNYCKDEAAIELNIQTRLKCWVGNCPWDLGMGVDYVNLLDKGTKARLVNAITKVIQNSEGVVKVNAVSANLDSKTRALVVEYSIDTVYSSGFVAQVNALAGVTGS